MRSLLEEIIASSNDAIVGKDLNGIVTAWNAAAERLFGYTAAEMIGASITRIIPPSRIDEEPSILERMRRGERLSQFETERVTKHGRVIAVSVTISPICDAAGRIIGVSKIARDLSEVHRLTDELRRQTALLQSILDTVPDGLIVIDARGIIQSISPAAERMFGFDTAEVLGRDVSLLMPAGHAITHGGYIDRYVETGERRVIGVGRVLAGQRKDGTEFPMELQIGEVRVGGARLFTGFVRDLTERQERERRFAELRSELIHMARLNDLGQMVSALAHEVGQPLTAISNYLRGMRRLVPAETSPVLAAAIAKAETQAVRAHDIVQNLRAQVRKEPRPRTAEDLAAIVRETCDLAMLEASGGITLDVRVPPASSAVLVDRIQIQQVLLNIMRNAAEAMAGAAVRRLTLTAARRGDRVEVRIADTGPGLPDAVRDRLFEPFISTKADGLGVGLSICRAIVEGHGGELIVESTPGRGAAFVFTVPAAGDPRGDDEPADRAPDCDVDQ